NDRHDIWRGTGAWAHIHFLGGAIRLSNEDCAAADLPLVLTEHKFRAVTRDITATTAGDQGYRRQGGGNHLELVHSHMPLKSVVMRLPSAQRERPRSAITRGVRKISSSRLDRKSTRLNS